jgi:hypothetical protein
MTTTILMLAIVAGAFPAVSPRTSRVETSSVAALTEPATRHDASIMRVDQEKPKEEKKLPEVLQLKADLAQAQIRVLQLTHENKALQVQLYASGQAVTALLQADAQAAGEAMSKTLEPLERDLVKAKGGDFDKGDRIDWASLTLIRKE